MNRKTTTILLGLFACISIAKGQIIKKSLLLGGQIYYQNVDYHYVDVPYENKVNTGTFNVSIGKALKENSVYGFDLQYSPYTSTNVNYGSGLVNVDRKQYSIGVFNRQYKTLAKDLYFFAESGAAFNNNKEVYTDTNSIKTGTLKQWGAQLNLTPGISYRILKKLHLEVTIPNMVLIQYIKTTDRPETANVATKSFTFYSSLNGTALSWLGVGFHFIL
jgi:hypothetical protein